MGSSRVRPSNTASTLEAAHEGTPQPASPQQQAAAARKSCQRKQVVAASRSSRQQQQQQPAASNRSATTALLLRSLSLSLSLYLEIKVCCRQQRQQQLLHALHTIIMYNHARQVVMQNTVHYKTTARCNKQNHANNGNHKHTPRDREAAKSEGVIGRTAVHPVLLPRFCLASSFKH